MVVIVGAIVVIAAVLAGFTLSGGTVGALFHPTELLTIGGAALGADHHVAGQGTQGPDARHPDDAQGCPL